MSSIKPTSFLTRVRDRFAKEWRSRDDSELKIKRNTHKLVLNYSQFRNLDKTQKKEFLRQKLKQKEAR